VELHHLRSFLAAVRLGTFNAAAAELSYTGPAISQHVAALERELGVELLARHARGVSPTPAGLILADRADELLARSLGIAHEVRRAADPSAKVRIGAFSTAAQFLLPPVLTAVLTERPDVELELIDREPPDGFKDVIAGRLDVMITHVYSGHEVAVPEGLSVEALVRDELVLLVPDLHWATDGVGLDELADERWVSGPPSAQNHVALASAAANAGFEPQVAFETTDYAVTMTLVATGLGPAGVRKVSLAPDPQMHRMISLVHSERASNDTVDFVLKKLRAGTAGAGKMSS
jgi:DNA-binding transcriptional LysR family regulator